MRRGDAMRVSQVRPRLRFWDPEDGGGRGEGDGTMGPKRPRRFGLNRLKRKREAAGAAFFFPPSSRDVWIIGFGCHAIHIWEFEKLDKKMSLLSPGHPQRVVLCRAHCTCRFGQVNTVKSWFLSHAHFNNKNIFRISSEERGRVNGHVYPCCNLWL
jgi:hypothetical protein